MSTPKVLCPLAAVLKQSTSGISRPRGLGAINYVLGPSLVGLYCYALAPWRVNLQA